MKLRSPVWPIILGVLVTLEIIQPYRGWVILLVGLGGAWLIGYLWARSLYKNVSLIRQMRFGWAQVGDILEERFEILNHSYFPVIWIEITDHSTIPNYHISRVTGVGSKSKNTWYTHQKCTQRGLFKLGPATLKMSDPMNIYSITIEHLVSSSILITPPILPLPRIKIAAGGKMGEGKPTRKAFDETISTHAVREYVAGDSLHHIHWPTSARKDSFFVKQFDSTPTSDWWIILDLDQKINLGLPPNTTEETAIIMAASLADQGIRSNNRVGLIANSTPPIWLPARSSDSQRWEILHALASAEAGELTLSELLDNVDVVIPQHTSMIVITSNPDGKWINGVLRQLKREVIPTIVLIDPTSYGSHVSITPLQVLLTDLNISHFLVDADLFTTANEATINNDWEWKTLSTGRAIPIHQPKDMSWRIPT